jgi:hypothetical protein
MTIKTYNKTNFHKYTFCIFNEVNSDVIKDLKLNFKSKSGSSYYFVENGVYRLSNHWGRAANCKWRLINSNDNSNFNDNKKNERTKLGFANWKDFYSDNDSEKLYFTEVNHEKQSVNFYHKQSESYSSNKVLRTSNETTKLIKQIRNLLDETAWIKHLKSDNVEELRKQIIDRLINSNQSFQEIRRDFL